MEAEPFTIEVSTNFVIENVGTAPTPVTLELTPKGRARGGPGGSDGGIHHLRRRRGLYYVDEADGAAIASHDYDTLVITGLSRDPRTGEELEIEVKNFSPGKKIIIDGETGLITEDGKGEDRRCGDLGAARSAARGKRNHDK